MPTRSTPLPPTDAPPVDRATAERLLCTLTGDPSATFRDGQWEAVAALALDRRRALVVQRTGWGKSAVYFLATRLLRDQGSGPTLLVSPLLALMRNQLDAARRLGLRAETLNSSNRDDWEQIIAAVRADEVDLLLISAQRLANAEFARRVLPVVAASGGLLVIDEAHCISDWGHDFNPDYRRIARVLDLLPSGVPVLACTATANDRVVADVAAQLGTDLVTLRGPLARAGLALSVVDLPAAADRLAWLARAIPAFEGSGIVYCLTVGDTERVAAFLRGQGIDAHPYSGTTDEAQRIALEQRLLAGDLKVLVATSALGMGFDKPDLAFVVHYQSPGSPVHYYQQVGRAGRRLERSQGVLLCGTEDADIQDWFIRTAFPSRADAEAVVDLLAASGEALRPPEIERSVNLRRSRLEAMLKVLEVEGAVERDGSGWRRTPQPWVYDQARVEGVTAQRRHEQQMMRTYQATTGCRMRLLAEALDDPSPTDCCCCDRCTGQPIEVEIDPQVRQAAVAHLRARWVDLAVRKQWPQGLGGRIPPAHQVRSARALGEWGDGGWGALVASGREQGRFADELVEAAQQLVRRWAPDPAPRSIVPVPSARHPGLVVDLAARLGAGLGIEVAPVLRRAFDRPPQRELHNSAQQVRNVVGAFELVGTPPAGPVLLVDDTWDSGWTATVLADLLAGAGVPDVHVFVLARANGD